MTTTIVERLKVMRFCSSAFKRRTSAELNAIHNKHRRLPFMSEKSVIIFGVYFARSVAKLFKLPKNPYMYVANMYTCTVLRKSQHRGKDCHFPGIVND